jgi:hypothetical protein
MSDRTIPVLLKDLGLTGDVEAITDCLTEYFHDANGLLAHQPSEEQLLRMGMTLESDRKKVLDLMILFYVRYFIFISFNHFAICSHCLSL